MPRFFFNLRQDDILISDYEGIIFHNLNSAIRATVLASRELMADFSQQSKQVDYGRIEINDASGKLLMIIPLPCIFNGSGVAETFSFSNGSDAKDEQVSTISALRKIV